MPRSTSPFSRAFSRRVLLKGAGCSMALPWLESVNALADTPAAGDFPKRFAVVFLGCGVNVPVERELDHDLCLAEA